MLDVITIGDAMVTFNPSATGPLRFVNTFNRNVGGAELNFAIGCARLGLKPGWISRLGNDEFGKYVLNFARGENIEVSQVKLVDKYPTSIYFKEMFEDGRVNSYYYRANSPTSTLTAEEIDEDYLKKARLLYVSGVFPAISQNNYEIIYSTVQMAKKLNIPVAFDPNLRLKLWSKEEAQRKLGSFLPYVDIILTGEEEASILLGVDQPAQMIDQLRSFGIEHIAIKQAEKGSIGYCRGELVHSPAKPVKAVDTVGAGDGFNAGYIYGFLNGWSLDKSLDFANTIGSMVVGVKGDNEGLPYLDEVLVRLGEKESIER